MRAVRRLAVAFLLAVALAATVGAAATQADKPPVPTPGHYVGNDDHGHKMSFSFTAAGRIKNFTTTKTTTRPLPGAKVNGFRWAKVCDHADRCDRGEWISATTVKGFWTGPKLVGANEFKLHLVGH